MFKVTQHGNVVFGSGIEDFPRHIQVAFGRNQARLCEDIDDKCKVWLRDLPLNVWDLAYQGFPHALEAFEAERSRIRGQR